MLNVIPAPHHFKPADQNGYVVIEESAWIDAGPGTELSARWLQSELTRFAGINLGQSEDTGVRIVLEINEVYEQIPITQGVHPDGGTTHDEGYGITVDDGRIDIVGMSGEAVFRGATTLLQMVALSARDGRAELTFGTIADAPRLAWRGLSFDTVRTFHPVETVKNVLDLLALYKFNVLHFHLTDSEGWRFHVDSWPLLTEVSGKTARNQRTGGFYTPGEFAELVQYAADRYIQVVPEFDTPGHTASVFRAYPELASDDIHAMPEAMRYLHPEQPRASELLRDVYSAMAAQTNAAYIHIGGDEAIAMDHGTFQQYIQMALPIARETGKGVVAWQEAARGGLGTGDLVQWWIPDQLVARVRAARESGQGMLGMDPNDPVVKAFAELLSKADEDIPTALEQGADVILSPSKWLYLDTKYTESSADPTQQERHSRVGMRPEVYENGTVQDSYDWNPATVNAKVPVDRIAGVEAGIWCESIVTTDDLFFQLLPRLAGVGEKAWSEHKEWEDHRSRLVLHPLFWDAMGLTWFKSSVVW